MHPQPALLLTERPIIPLFDESDPSLHCCRLPAQRPHRPRSSGAASSDKEVQLAVEALTKKNITRPQNRVRIAPFVRER